MSVLPLPEERHPHDLLSIGRMAALNCVSEKTLHLYQRRGIVEPRYVDPQTGYRYYGLDQCSTLDAVSQLKTLGFSLVDIEGLQRRGIVEPRYVDPQTGYRYYGLDQCSTLDAVSQLKTLGFSLVDIEGLLKESDIGELQRRLTAQMAEIERQECSTLDAVSQLKTLGFSLVDIEGLLKESDIGELQRRLTAQMAEIERQERELTMAKCMARHLLDACAAVRGTTICDQIMLEVLPERRALVIDVPPVSPDDIENRQWEHAVRAAKRDLADRGFPMSLFQNVSGIVHEEELRRGTFVTHQAIIFLSDELADLLESAAICSTCTVPGAWRATCSTPARP